jgi:folate-binding protein YgfZ
VQIICGGDNKPYWFELWTDPSHAAFIASRITGSGGQPVGAEALELWRILHGIPQYGKDIRDRDLPQETGQTHALHFSKGCYIGQEIVERIRSRGQVHRKFTGFEFTGQPPEIGKFEVDGRTVAEITSVARIPSDSGSREIGLGYVRLETLPSNRVLELNGVNAAVVDLPFRMQPS